MALSAPSPSACGAKRLFEERAGDLVAFGSPQQKRGRFGVLSPAGLESGPCCGVSSPHDHGRAYVPGPSVLRTLCSLFPEMDDKSVAAVLDECNDDVEAAIRRLNEMRLGAGADGGAAEPSPATSPPAAAEPPKHSVRTAEEWVVHTVNQMACAKDLDEAKARAAGVLKEFEACVQHASKQSEAAMGARLRDALKENGILKKAVAIQNARLQETASKDAELAAVKAALSTAHERVRGLELANYTLQLHLRHAADAAAAAAPPANPDVF